MVTFNTPLESEETEKDPSWALSMLAGIPSGVIKIAEGAATLGATLLDLGVDKDRAEAVEQYFADINPFDELAQSTAIGKITELIVNIGVPGGLAFKAASGLGKATLRAQQAGKVLTKGEKVRRFGQGALGAGAAEGVFVGNVEDAGTFGDFLGGPTEIDRTNKGDPATELMNRLKFGVEGVAFTGAFGAAGKLVSKMREVRGTNKAKRGFEKGIEKFDSWFRANGIEPMEGFDAKNIREGLKSADTNVGDTAMRVIDPILDRTTKSYKKVATDKVDTKTARNEIANKMNEVLMSGESERVLSKQGLELYEMYKKASFDPVSKKGRYKTQQEFLKDLINGKSNPVLVSTKKGDLQIKNTPTDKTANLKNFTTEINKSKKIRPIFGKVDEYRKDPKTGAPGATKEFKTGKQVYDVQLGPMNVQMKEALRKELVNKYKADPDDVKKMFEQFGEVRDRWGELFTVMGKRFTPESLKQFQDMLPKYINDVLDRGYETFKNNPIKLADNIKPVKAEITEAIKQFKSIASKKLDPETGKPIVLSDDVARDMVDEVWRGAELPKGFTIGERTAPGQVRFKNMPSFLTKSLENKVTQKNISTDFVGGRKVGSPDINMEELTGAAKPVIQRLLGKARNPMSSIVEGMANLSSMVRSNQFYDNLIRKNNELVKRYDEWLDGGRVGPEPQSPFLFNNTGEARKYAGARGDDVTLITADAGDAAREIDRWVDSSADIKNIDITRQVSKKASAEVQQILNPLQGKYALNDYAESFLKSQNSELSFPQQLYNNLVLYPKGLSQMSKTILAPFTHARNFLSATAFAAANGILPYGNIKDVRAAWNALQVAGPGTRKSNQFYQELLELGVVNSNVQLKQVQDILADADFGGALNKVNGDWGLNKLLKKLGKAKRFAEDAYTAEDDFWKIFTFLGEKTRLDKAYRKAGLQLGQEFTDMNGVKRIFNDRTLKEMAADRVKNNVPNYAFVSDFIKGLRKLPVGNFVAFPAEIIRTSSNIVETALKEINYSTVINGKTVNPLRGRGLQRLTGMAATTAVLPLGAVASAQAIYNVADEEIDAMRRYVADWSKNSVLVPFKDENGKLSYIDFSHLNAYDTVTRPIQTILNAVNSGRADEDGLIDDFVLGMIESTKELGEPFISEAIWTKALQDVSPILGRGGVDATGRRIWNEEDALGDKLQKAIGHLVEAQAPLNWKQMKRLGMSIEPINRLTGKFDERGNEYDFGNELAGIAGMRRVEIDPEKSFNYKITDFKNGIRNSRNLFTSATLKGGPVTPEEIVDAYINANRALYKNNREMYEDIKAAKILGMSDDSLVERMVNRGERRAFSFLNEGLFRPLSISPEVQSIFQIRADELGISNPYEQAADAIANISETLSETSLDGDLFPEIQNPFNEALIPNVVGQVNQMIGNNPATAAMAAAPTAGFIGQGNVNIDPVTRLTSAEDVLLDPLEKRYVKNKRTNTRLT